ncbi:MAG: RsmE family RNA methyltransferase [Spirochaetes bacterium]|jgi:16S rRNA (uracil1498-N3)-methyltransferase|nr:RsmE family RNA methyltransferase [Spirochaetota bacterium]
MKQLILPKECVDGEQIVLSGDEFHYLVRVRRYGEGASLPARSPAGFPFELTIERLEADSLTATVTAAAASRRPGPEGAVPEIILYQGLAKGKKLDLVVRQATEAGIAAIVPISTSHSVVSLSDERAEKRVSRLERVAREAAQQSGAARVPSVEEVLPVADIPALDRTKGEVGFVFHEKALAAQVLHEYLRANPKRVYVAVGPEGGFSGDEITELTTTKSFVAAGLGSNVLRSETAALYAIAAIQTIARERQEWT